SAPAHFLRCRSSVVEHSLGKGEVHSSILCGSTIPPLTAKIAHKKKAARKSGFLAFKCQLTTRTSRRSPSGSRLSHLQRPCAGRPSPCPSCLPSRAPCRPWLSRRRP